MKECLAKLESVDALNALFTPEEIKNNLTLFGMKAGGRPEERAGRLFAAKQFLGDLTKIPKNLLAKKAK